MPDTERILAANQALRKEIALLGAKLDRLGTRTSLVIAGGVVLLLMFAGNVVALIQVDHANNRATRLQEYNVSRCQSGNDFRSTIREFLASVEPTTPPEKMTAAQRRAQAAFR